MKNSLKITLACTLLGVGFFAGTPRAHAALLAYEGFDYTAGDVNARNGGTGWSGGWNSVAGATVVTGTTLGYTGGTISVNGSGTALSITGGSAGQLNRGFVGTSTGSEIYFSLLFQVVAGSGNEFSNFYLSNDPDLNNSGGFGDLSTAASDSRFGARIYDGAGESSENISSTSYAVGTTYLLVGRLSTAGSAGAAGEIDQVDLWVNPTSLTPGTASATVNTRSTGLTLADFDVFSSRMINFADTDRILIDELRIGTDFASVVAVPEPSVAGLLLLGGASCLAWRRKAVR